MTLTDYLAARIRDFRVALADLIDPGRFHELTRKVETARYRARLARVAKEQFEDAINRINQKARMGSLPGRTVVAVDRFAGGIERETVLTADAVRHVDLGITIEFEPGGISASRDGLVLFREKVMLP